MRGGGCARTLREGRGGLAEREASGSALVRAEETLEEGPLAMDTADDVRRVVRRTLVVCTTTDGVTVGVPETLWLCGRGRVDEFLRLDRPVDFAGSEAGGAAAADDRVLCAAWLPRTVLLVVLLTMGFNVGVPDT